MGYNLAIEYMADYEKTWMLDSFRALDRRVLAPAGRPLSDWVFLEVRRAALRCGWGWPAQPLCLSASLPLCLSARLLSACAFQPHSRQPPAARESWGPELTAGG